MIARALSHGTLLEEQSSSKHKAMSKTIQSKAHIVNPAQLILDMKVQWLSTYLMLHRAEQKKEVSTLLSFEHVLINF